MAAIPPRHIFPFENLKNKVILIGYVDNYDVYANNIEPDGSSQTGWIIMLSPRSVPEIEVRRTSGGKWKINRRCGNSNANTVGAENTALAMLNEEEQKQYLGDALERLEV